MRVTAKSLLSAAANALMIAAAAAYYIPAAADEYYLYRRSGHDLSGHPSRYNIESRYYAPPARHLYRRTKVANDADAVYVLKAHLQPGKDEYDMAGHSTLFITKEHSKKSTKYQANFNTQIKRVPGEVERAYKFDKKKVLGTTPEAIQADHGGELLILGQWSGKAAGKALKDALTPKGEKGGNNYKAHPNKGCHEYARDAIARIQNNPSLKGGLKQDAVKKAEKFFQEQCAKNYSV